MGPNDHLERMSFNDTHQQLISLQGDILALSRDAETRLNEVLSSILKKREDNLSLEKAFYLEKVKKEERAELDSINKLHRMRLQHQRILTETMSEAFNRQARIEEAHAIKRAEALKNHAAAISTMQEAAFKREEQVGNILLGQFDAITTTTASKITELQALLQQGGIGLNADGAGSPPYITKVTETREKLDADNKPVTELVEEEQFITVAHYFNKAGDEIVLAAGETVDNLGRILDTATGAFRKEADGITDLVVRTEETTEKTIVQVERVVMETSERVITATDLATEAIKKRFIDLRIALAETGVKIFEWETLHNDEKLEAEWRYLAEAKRVGEQRLAITEEVDRRLLALGIAYNDERGRGHENTFGQGAKKNVTDFGSTMKNTVFGKDEKFVERLKGIGEAFKELFDTNNLWSVENNVLTRMALDNQKKAADYFVEQITGSGKTLGERLEAASKLFTRKDALGNMHTIEGDKAAFAQALEQLKTAFDGSTASKTVTYKTKEKGTVVEKEAKSDKEFIKAINQTLKDNKKSGKWDEIQKAKLAWQTAEADPSKDPEQVAKLKEAFTDALKNANMSEEMEAAASAAEQQKATTQAGWANATAMLASISAKLDGLIDDIAKNQSVIDTRLAGSEKNSKTLGSYWRKISFDMSATMMSPLIREQTLIDNIMAAVDKGIARDVQQMGMLETMKDKIATTFDVFDGTMLRLIRIQDKNTTAARLGMEASLNSFLNQMYESTEYLNSLASSVRGNLEEAQALMSAEDAVDFEYQVQKWLGSLSSVGVSDQGVMAIADAIGKLAAGDVEGITNGGAGNLVVMAANNANISIADALADGLDASETNVLLNQMVGYMYDLTQEANGNLVVQQQLAKVFGLAASDLKAATNLIYEYNDKTGQMKTIYNKGTGDTYNQMLGELFAGANQMYARTSLGEMLTNMWENVQYSTAAGMANDPALYLITKSANILDEFAGGIPIPAITAFGTGVDTKLTVSNIMKTAAMVGGFTKSLVSMIASSIGNGGGGFTGSGLLKLVGVQSKVSRGASTSSSGKATVYNASVEDTTESATQSGKDSAKQETASAKEESSEVTNETLNESVLSIYKLLDGVINGNSTLRVHVAEPAAIPVKVENVSEFASAWTP